MDYRKQFLVKPGSRVRLADLDHSIALKGTEKKSAASEFEKLKSRMDELQFRLYAERKHSLLICLQAPDAGGKDGTIRHVFGSINPQGCRVVSFKEPSSEELAHDFLWRIGHHTPRKGEIMIFNRSHYEDVLIVRVHDLVPKKVWSQRYELINDFEKRLVASGTQVLKFYLHISKDEQLRRFKKRLEDPERHWKISDADYSERRHWNDYRSAYEDALSKCNTPDAPWFVIPSDDKAFRNLAISSIIVDALEKMDMQLPKPTVNLAEIRKKYHEAVGRKMAKKVEK